MGKPPGSFGSMDSVSVTPETFHGPRSTSADIVTIGFNRATEAALLRSFPSQPIDQLQRVYGRFYYRDIFGRRHSCGFINEIGPNGESVPILAPAAYTEER